MRFATLVALVVITLVLPQCRTRVLLQEEEAPTAECPQAAKSVIDTAAADAGQTGGVKAACATAHGCGEACQCAFWNFLAGPVENPSFPDPSSEAEANSCLEYAYSVLLNNGAITPAAAAAGAGNPACETLEPQC